MIWAISQFPELDHLDPEQRAAVLERMPRWTYPTIVARSAVIGFFIAGFLIGAPLESSRVAPEVALIAFVLGAAGIAVWSYSLQLRRVRKLMRNFIAEGFRDQCPPFCFSCGYDLRASFADLCPECGAACKVANPAGESPAAGN